MTVQKAKLVLGSGYQNETDRQIQSYIDAAMGLTEVFFQQFRESLEHPIDKELKNE